MQRRLVQCFSLLMYTALTVLGVWLGAKFFLPWAAPFLLAFALAGLVEGAVRALVKRGFRRGSAAALLTLGLIGAFIWAAVSLSAWCVSAVTGFAKRVPELMSAMGAVLENMEDALLRYAAAGGEGMGEYVRMALSAFGELAYTLPSKISAWALDLLAKAASRSPDALLFGVTAGLGTYFISSTYPRTFAFLQAQLPPGLSGRLEGLGRDLKSSFGGFFKAQLMLMAMSFFLLLGGLSLVGAENPVMMAALTALVDALPVFGTGIILIPWALYSFLLGRGGRAAALLGLWLGINLLRSCLQAKLLGDQIGLEPLPSLVAVYVGWRVWGVWGMLSFPILLVTLRQLNDKGVIRLWKSV